MKIIKTFSLVTISLFVSTLLHAQELKTEVGKPIEPKLTSADNRPSPAPVLKPDPKFNSNGQPSKSELKTTETTNTTSTAKDEEAKPQIVAAKNSAAASTSTTDVIIPNTVLPKPMMSPVSNTTAKPPVVKELNAGSNQQKSKPVPQMLKEQ
jgi:hypothetical protein